MPQFDTDKPKPKAKAFGVLLAGIVAVGSLALVFVAHEPKDAASSPRPAKAAIVPQIADTKSEAEILFRGKSFASYQRSVVAPFAAEITRIHIKEGEAVEAGRLLATYEIEREPMINIHNILYPNELNSIRQHVRHRKLDLDKLRNVQLKVRQTELATAKENLEDARELKAKRMLQSQAVEDQERRIEIIEKQIREIMNSIDQVEADIEKSEKQLKHAQNERRRRLDLLEWQTKRSYTDPKHPLNRGFLKAPISGHLVWMHSQFRENAQVNGGMHVMTVAPVKDMVVRCKVHELDLVKLRRGDRGTVTFDAIADKKYTCKITRIPWVSRNPALEVPADYEIECALDNPDGMLKEGLTCNVKVSVTQ